MQEGRAFPDGNSSKLRIVLVEDEPELRQHLVRSLCDDYLITAASNGKEAWDAVQEFLPALVITDIVMPEVGGIELLKALRARLGPA